MTASTWSGRGVDRARAIVARTLPAPCGRCGKTVHPDPPDTRPGRSGWVVGHIVDRWARPDLTWDPTNWQPEHRACSDASGQSAVIAKARAAGAAAVSSHQAPPGQTPRLPVSLPAVAPAGAWTVQERLSWAHHVQAAPAWLQPYLAVPENASPPLAMTGVHPAAVGSYGPDAIAWIEEHREITLRWWQRLAIVRQLEHDADGRLCWRTVVESAPRRAGKSERLRSLALWRMEHGVDLFEPYQVIVHVGRDLSVVREVQERAWSWCEGQGWEVTRGNGKEKVQHPNGARWLAKAQHAGYGFDVHLGLADECWDVDPGAISEGIEPATLERVSAQLVLTSTSHRRATSLMKRRISAALAVDDGRTLLLLWGVTPGADIFDEATWRAASPHWSQDRRDMIASTLLEAQESGPELDDPDPVGSWAHQYLNRWDLVVRAKARGDVVVGEEPWGGLVAELVDADLPPVLVAVEGWFADGVSVARAWRLEDGRVLVSVTDHGTLEEAAAAVKATGCVRPALVGASLQEDPVWRQAGVRTRPATGRTSEAVADLARLLAEGGLAHDGGAHLSGQVLELRTTPSADGVRLASKGRADAVKAAMWVASRVRKMSTGGRRIVLPPQVSA